MERRRCTRRRRDCRPVRSLPRRRALLRVRCSSLSTELDTNLSFNIGASVARARRLYDYYKQRGVGPERVLIKLASMWEGIRAAQILQSEGVKCDVALLLNRA